MKAATEEDPVTDTVTTEAACERPASLRDRVARGVFWSAIPRWGSQAINLLVFVILARRLEPEAFGLVALASVFVAFVQVFLDQGMAGAIVQRAELGREHLDTAFWTSILTGGLLTIGGVLFSEPVAHLLGDTRLRPIVAWLSIGFFLAALSSTQQAILERKLDFKSLAARTLVSKLVGGAVGLGAAFLGLGVWSLVAQSLATALAGVVVLWRVSDWRPTFGFSRECFLELFGFGINMVGLKVLYVANSRLGDFLIGYHLGATALGYYTVGQHLLNTVSGLTGVIHSVAFPAFSRLQDQRERLRRAFYRAVAFTALLAFPILLGIAVLAPELVPALFGSQWSASIPVIQVLVLGGIGLSVLRFNSELLKACGKPQQVLLMTVLGTLANALGVMLLAPKGIVAVAAVLAFVRYGFAPIYIWMIHRTIRLDFRVYFNQYVAPLAGSLTMIAVVLGMRYVLGDSLGLYGSVIIYSLSGFVAYLAAVQLTRPSAWSNLVGLALLAVPKRQ